jgi:hypothetical protein
MLPALRCRHRHAVALCGALAAAGAGAQDAAQHTTEDFTTQTELVAHATEGSTDPHKTSWVFLPIPQASPALGTGLTLVGAALYNPNGSARPWVTGAAIMGTSSSSHAVGLAQQASFLDNRLRVIGALGEAELRLKFYGIGPNAASSDQSLPMTDEGRFLLLQGLYGVTDHVFVGLRLTSLRLHTTIDLTALEEHFDILPSALDLDHRTTSLGPAMEYDSRDNQFMPASGSYGTARVDVASTALGSDMAYRRLHADFSHYWSVSPDLVVAGRAATCAVSGDVPFTELCLYGTSNDLRGYTTGQYRDRNLYAVQAEARWRFSDRWGAVAFGGTGAVAHSFGDLFSNKQLPAGGIGLRWLASERYKVDVSLDGAWGRNGGSVYFYLGQAF